MFTFGWGEILLVFTIVVIVIGPKDLPKLIRHLSSFTKSIKKLSREFKTSFNELADSEDLKNVKSSINEVTKIKDELNIKDTIKTEVQSIKETSDIIEKEFKDFKNISKK